ncbi:MAG: hypothetical protein ACJ77A_00950 [Actinomycetota bacterium]
MTDRMPGEDERRLRQALERLSVRAPRAFEPPPTMLHRARRRVAATALGAVLVLSAATVGGVALTRAVADRPLPIPIGPHSPSPTERPPASACAFTPVTLPKLPFGRDGLLGVTGTSPDDVWVGGGRFNADFGKPEHTRSLLLYWDGSSMTLLPPREDVSGVNSIDAIAPDDVWAATETGPWHWDGTAWSQVGDPILDGNTLAISASGPDDVWAVGGNAFATAPFIEHFDGTRWTEVATPASLHQPPGGPLSIGLNAVAALAPDDAWAVGGYFFQGQGTERPEPPVVLHWDGSQWTIVDMPPPGDAAYEGWSVAAGGPDDVWVAAEAIFPSYENTPGLVLHWDGSIWRPATLVSAPGTVLHIHSIDVGGHDDAWAAGSAFDPSSKQQSPVIEHFDGTGWAMVPVVGQEPGAPARIASVRIIGDEIWAVGTTGLGSALEHPPFVSVCR